MIEKMLKDLKRLETKSKRGSKEMSFHSFEENLLAGGCGKTRGATRGSSAQAWRG